MRPSRDTRQRLLQLARGLGLEAPARAVWELTQPGVRRDRVDTSHFRAVAAASLAPDACCVDAGAHRGDLLDDMVRIAPAGRHVAIEPLPEFAAMIRARFDRQLVTVHEVALSDQTGTARFVRVPQEPALSGLSTTVHARTPGAEVFDVVTRRLDDLLEPDFPVAMLKLDVEGGELRAVHGAERTISTHRPLIYLEHHSGPDTAALFNLLTGPHRYRIFDVRGQGPYTVADLADAGSHGVSNFIASGPRR